MYKYLVYGAGRQGVAVIYDLIVNCEAESVVVVEPSAEARGAAIAHLQEILPAGSGGLIISDFVPDWQDFDCVLSCAPYAANIGLTIEAIRTGIPFCDLGGNPSVVQEQSYRAENSSAPVVADCGISPGISNILAVDLALNKGCRWLRVRCGGLPIHNDDFIGYKLFFSPQGLLSEYSGDVPIIRNGEYRTVPALSVVEDYARGVYEASPTSNNSPHTVRHLLSLGVSDYNYMTIRHPGHWAVAQEWDLSTRESVDSVVGMLTSDDRLVYHPGDEIDHLILKVLGRNDGNQLYSHQYNIICDRRNKFSSMELATSWGITIVAHWLASRWNNEDYPGGFHTPEQLVDIKFAVAQFTDRANRHTILEEMWK
jgi:saccharopine dehydrogenase-like NADP-dependent oxidoreductase